MNIFIDTKRLEKLRKILVILDIIAILVMIVSYIASGYKIMWLFNHIVIESGVIFIGTHHACVPFIFLGLGAAIIFSLQIWMVQSIIKMVEDAYKYSGNSLKKEEKKEDR